MGSIQQSTSGQLEEHLSAKLPHWRLASDSNELELFGADGEPHAIIALEAHQTEDIRSLTGMSATRIIDITLGGNVVKLHLVGRKIDSSVWGGDAAPYGGNQGISAGLERSLAFAEQVVSEANSLIVILDSETRIRRFNYLCEELSGMKETEVIGQKAFDLFVGDSYRKEAQQRLNSFFRTEKTWEVTRPVRSKSGIRMIRWSNTIIESGTGVREKFLVCSGTDVTEELHAQKKWVKLANCDVLTGLLNRNSIQQRISEAVAVPGSPSFGLLFLDLDNFKKVNDHYGHATGDMLIRAVASALKSCLHPDDIIARLGGDEFLIMVTGSTQDLVEATAQQILDRLRHPFKLGQVEVHTGCSIGLSMYPTHGTTLEALVRSADTAMYVAKEEGKRVYRVFTAEMNRKISEYIWLDNNMRRALAEEQFELYYQPKVSLATGSIDSVEALIRWNHPERGLVSPGDFIPYAEESGLIVGLGRWVMQSAARQAGLWKRKGLDIRIAINLSARQLRIPTIVEEFSEAITSNDVLPSMVDLELTESCLLDDEKHASFLIRKFRELGSQVHLDDFGTGYSSLSQLTRLPLDVLKLDGGFISSIHTDEKARALVRSMVAVGHELNLKIVAECVETQEQADFLRAIGVDYGQGYLYSKPVPAAQFEEWLAVEQLKARPRLVACG